MDSNGSNLVYHQKISKKSTMQRLYRKSAAQQAGSMTEWTGRLEGLPRFISYAFDF